MDKDNPSSSISRLIYVLVWPVLVLIHSFAIGREGTEIPFFWQEPERYYSTWLLDLLLIGVWYLNYYILAPHMFKRRQFMAYIIVVLLLMTLGIFCQLALHHVWGLGMPSHPFGAVPSFFGCVSVLALMALGLSIRGVQNWITLEKQVETLLNEQKLHLVTIAELKQKLILQTGKPESDLSQDFNGLEGQAPLMWEDDALGIPPEKHNLHDESTTKADFSSIGPVDE